jgi:hypothetical protein
MGMLETGGGHRLPPGLLNELAVILGNLHADALDGHGATKVMVPSLVDITKAAGADQFLDFEALPHPTLRIRGGRRTCLRGSHCHK